MLSRSPIALREGGGSILRRGWAVLLLAASAGSAAAVPPRGAADAASIASAFRDICVRAGFDRGRSQAALERLGWVRAGSARTDAGKGYEFTHWEFPLGEVQVGFRTIGGVELKTFSCTLVVKGAAAAPRAELEAALEATLATARFRDARSPPADFARVAMIKDREDEQEFVGLWGNRVPVRARGTIVLGPGIAIDYGYAKGPLSRKLTGR
ncbi:MAG TPA: hypothetical protein VF652_10745 [Allosphingosinicella sp.]|jgi:hypothetical protein